MMPIETLNYYLALGAIVLQVCIVLVLADHVLYRGKYFREYIKKYALVAVFLTSSVATMLTLTYSEYFGVAPCGLCWLGRAFMFPLPIIFGIALYQKHKKKDPVLVADYGIGLALVGLLVSAYHHYLQMGGSAFVSCPTAGAGVDCAKRIIFEFGYVTFPLLAATLFSFCIVLLLSYRASHRS